MKRIPHLLKHWSVHILAGICLVIVVWTFWESRAAKPVPEPRTMQAIELPLAYDLCLAIISAYIFNLLIVVLPARRRQASRLLALLGPLTTIARNGMDLIRELERVAMCPHHRMTAEHLEAVLKGIHNNEYIRHHIDNRTRETQKAYQDIIPYSADLPLDLQERLQRENQNLMHQAFNDYSGKRDRKRYSLKKLRTPSDGMTLYPYLGLFMQYYTATEAVREILNKYMPPIRYGRVELAALRLVRRSQTFDLENTQVYPYPDYPPPLVFKPRVTADVKKDRKPMTETKQDREVAMEEPVST